MNKKAFTLIELIVGITISMILMVSVGIFVSSGMSNILLGQKVLENTGNFTDFANKLNTSFNLIQSGSFISVNTASGIIFKRGQNLGEGGFSYIGTETLSGVYCKSDSENPETKNIFIKTFIPFEEQGEDIFSTDYDLILTGSLIDGVNTYISYQKENIITKNGTTIIGKGVFGDKFTEGALGTDIYLNSPTGLTASGNILFISDTLNNRILYYDTTDSSIHKLLDESDGLNEPTGLYYDNDSSLYIANSGNGEILKYSSKSILNNPNLNLSFSGIKADNINRFSIEFLTGTIDISSPNEISEINDFSFINITNDIDYLTGSTNKLEYYFADYISSNSVPNTPCSSNYNYYTLEGNNPVQKIINNCNTNTGTLVTYSGNLQTNFISGNTYEINISNITPILSNTGNYYVNLKLFEGLIERYSGYFPYFSQSDNDLTTPNDNILTVEVSGLNYPTGIWGITTSDYNEFGNRTFSNKILNYHNTDTLLGTPVKSLDITNSADDLITLLLKYYKSYNCYNLDEKIERTYLLKKNLK